MKKVDDKAVDQDEKGTETNFSKIIIGIPEKTKAARIYEDGRIEILKHKISFNEWGNSRNSVSPDGQFLIYVKNRNLYLLNIDSGEQIDIHILSSDADFTGLLEWSANSDKVAFGTQKKEDKINYYIYDIKNRTKTAIDFPGDFRCWAADDAMVFSSENSLILKGNQTKKIPVQAEDFSQISRSPDGKILYASYKKAEQIVSLDLDSGKITAITPQGKYAEYQGPKPSPSGRKTAYIRHPERDVEILEVNNDRIIQKRDGWLIFEWISNRTILTKDRCGLRLVDIITKTVKNLKNYPEVKYDFLCYPDGRLPSNEEIINRNNFRVISESGLFLREEPSEKSKKILLIPFAHTVLTSRRLIKEEKVQGRKGYWTLVSYYQQGRTIEGWVFDGFLGTIQKRVVKSEIAEFTSGCLGSSCTGYGAHRLAPDGTYLFGPRCEGDEIITGRWAVVGSEIHVCSRRDCNPAADEKYIIFIPTEDGRMIYQQKGLSQIELSPEQINHWEPIH